MRIHRFLSLTDVVVLLLVSLAILLSTFPRPLHAVDTYKLDADERADLAIAEAVARARPDDGAAQAALSWALLHAGQTDWAVEVARDGAARATAPTRWQVLRAQVAAHAKRGEAEKAIAAADLAIEACRGSRATCDDWQEHRIRATLAPVAPQPSVFEVDLR
jgi:hypothetical protein